MKRKLPNLMFNLTETAVAETEKNPPATAEEFTRGKKISNLPAPKNAENKPQEMPRQSSESATTNETIEMVLKDLIERYLAAKASGEKVVLSLRFPPELDLFFKALPATLRIELANTRRQIPKEDMIAQILLRVLTDESLRQSVIIPLIEELIERRR